MIPIIHKVNSIESLKKIPKNYGVELDIRNSTSGLILSHELSNEGTLFDEYLEEYNNELLVANIKESGTEDEAIRLIKNKNIDNFFLLDVEFPYIYQNFELNKKYLSTRFSKYESIDSVKNLINKVEWLWVDTYSDFDIDNNCAEVMSNFKICLVSPSRWGLQDMVDSYLDKFKNFAIKIDAIMIENDEKFTN